MRGLAALGAVAIATTANATEGGPAETREKPEAPISRIAFGSCWKPLPGRDGEIFDKITATDPDLFLFMGDNVYADTEDMAVMRAKYDALGALPAYRRLRDEAEILATWDDHDYGKNDAGAEFPMRAAAQREFLRFFQFPPEAPQWKRPGVYSARRFGPDGKRVQIMLLDTRYFRSALEKNRERRKRTDPQYLPNDAPGATVLGEAQWRWLEEQLRLPADLRIIVSSIQVIPTEHPFEKWSNFPKERQRLLKLVRDTGADGVVLLSGDRHHSEISQIKPDAPAPIAYPLTEITSSALGDGSRNQGEANASRISPSNYCEPNFGMIEIDWDADGGPILEASIRDAEGKPAFAHKIALSSLRP